MSFSSQIDVRYLVDQFYYWLQIRCMKTPTVLKCQQFEESGSDKTETKGSKRQRLDNCDNEEGNTLDKDEGEIEGTRYVHPLFVPLRPLPLKVSNRLSDLGKGTRRINHLISILKICYSRSAKFALEFPDRGGSKAQKKSILAA